MSKKLTTEEDEAELRKSLNRALEAIRHSDPSIDFPNYMAEIGQMSAPNADVALVEGFIQSVLDRLRIPHMYNGEITSADYFEHLHQTADALAADKGVDVELYIAGGVVRTMLANMYKFVHERKAQQGDYRPDIVVNAVAEAVKHSDDVKDKMDDVQEQMLLKHKMLHSTEFHLKQAALGEKELLLAPYVLGVGSDLDIYYEVLPKGKELTAKEKQAGEDIARSLVGYMNKVENEFGFREQTGSFKHSILPNADVKEYNQQVTKSLAQGGSLIDSLAYKIKSKLIPRLSNQQADSRMRHPDAHPHILRDFFAGFYEYLSPPSEEFQGKISQKQAIRGLRPLLEMPFLDIKDKTVIVEELQKVLEDIESGKTLDEKANKQFDKMVRNANFQLGKNRPYQSEENAPLSLGLKIADAAFLQGDKLNEKVRFLLPSFLQSMPIEADDASSVEKDGLHHEDLKNYLLSKEAFIEEHTDNGLLYHGTNAEAGLSVLRGGFIVSTKKQGTAVYGPGVYTTPDKREAGGYAGDGIVIPMNLSQENAKTLDWGKASDELKRKLEQEAKDKGFEHVFELLRDRNEYAVDIIIDTHVIIQNQKAINIEQSLESILEMLSGGIVLNFEKMIREDSVDAMPSYFTALNYYKKYRELFKQLGVDVSQNIEAEVYFDKHYSEGLEKYIGEELIGKKVKGHNVLTFAVINRYNDIVKILLEKKPELLKHVFPSIIDYNAFTLAVTTNNTILAQYLFNFIYSDDRGFVIDADVKTLVLAIDDSHAEHILKNKPDLLNYTIMDGPCKGYNIFMLALVTGNSDLVHSILKLDPAFAKHTMIEENNALTYSLKGADAGLVELILDKAPETANHVIAGGFDKGHNALTLAIKKGDSALAKIILEKAPDSAGHVVTGRYGKGHNALTLAIEKGDSALAKIILEKAPETENHVLAEGFDKGHNALTLAIKKGDSALAKIILEKAPETANHVITGSQYDDGKTALILAIQKGHVEFVKMILEVSPESVNYVITGSKYDDGHIALTKAAEKGDIDLFKLILEVSPDSINNTITTESGRSYNILEFMISRAKFDLAHSISELAPQLVEKSKNIKEAYNDAICCYGLDIAGIQLCVENGVDIDFKDKDGKTLLEQAIWGRNAGKIEKLLEMGADANVQKKDSSWFSSTLLFGFGMQTLKLLVQYGADINALTSKGETCLQMAEQCKNAELIAWVKEEMAASNMKENPKEVSQNQARRKTMIHLGKIDKDKTVAAESSKVEPKNENDENTENPSRKPSSKKSG